MAEIRRRQIQRAIEMELPESGPEQVRSPHHFGQLEGGVIDHDGQLVGRHVILSPDYEIAKLVSRKGPLRPGSLIEKFQRFAFSHRNPNQARSSTSAARNSGRQRSRSRSSIRRIKLPFRARDLSCARQKVAAWPTCKKPVGEGASRPR